VTRSLPLLDPVVVRPVVNEPVPAEGACCAACAAERAPTRPPLPVLQAARSATIRGTDRRITFAGVLAAAAILGVAGLSAIGSLIGGTVWLPLHLAMAGAAGTAIAAVLPFFTTALVQVAPAPVRLRIASIVLVAGGSILAGVGMQAAGSGVAVVGGVAYVSGLLAIAVAAFRPLRTALGFRFRLVHLAYATALTQVGAGVALATAMLAGWSPIVTSWVALKPAHAWLNVFGFVTLVVAASLVHLAPTVAGARIRPRRSADVALLSLIAGAPIVALGLATGWDPVARTGAVVELVGAVALFVHGVSIQRDRGAWTSDPGWHRFAGLSLVAAPAWLLVAVAIAGGGVLWLGATPAAWSVTFLAVPLVAGGVGQILVGAWTHLVPAIGPGDQARHARQRAVLGRLSYIRWVAWNGGVAIASIGVLAGAEALRFVGALVFGLSAVTSAILLVRSTRA